MAFLPQIPPLDFVLPHAVLGGASTGVGVDVAVRLGGGGGAVMLVVRTVEVDKAVMRSDRLLMNDVFMAAALGHGRTAEASTRHATLDSVFTVFLSLSGN